MGKTVAIVGASTDHRKFGNKAVRAFQKAGWIVYPVNPNLDTVEGLKCYHSIADVPDKLDRISMYVPPAVGKGMLPELAEKHHMELWLNPGAEDAELVNNAKELGLNPVCGCSIIDIGMRPSMFP